MVQIRDKNQILFFSRVLDDVSWKSFSMVVRIYVCTDVLVISEVMAVRNQIISGHTFAFLASRSQTGRGVSHLPNCG